VTPAKVALQLCEKYASEIEAILARYPAEEKRSAVMPLLHLAQREHGYVTRAAMDEIAQLLNISSTQVASIVGFYTLLYAQPGGRHRIQICTDLPCALRGADEFAEQVCANLGVKLGETTADGQFTVEAVMCLAACDKAPMFQLQNGTGISYHERQSAEDVRALVEELRAAGAGRGETESE
jgi:NADH-quinone oxidoreductase subunit E|tara:strand:- start:260 stop:802 length:543 start_codon:yes stop_codon:yes gene_type:complete